MFPNFKFSPSRYLTLTVISLFRTAKKAIFPQFSRCMSDKVHISGLESSAIAGLDHWQKPAPHPVLVDVTFTTDFSRASDLDNLHYSLNYAVISDKILAFLRENHQRNFKSLGGVGEAVYALLEEEKKVSLEILVNVLAPKLDIRAPVSFQLSGPNFGVYKISGLRCLTLIGVFTFERLNKQYVLLDIELQSNSTHLDVPQVSELVHEYLELANFKTVEALVKRTSQWIFQNFGDVSTVSVRVTKPNAIVYTSGVGVSCRCERSEFAGEIPITLPNRETPEQFDLPVSGQNDFSGENEAYVAFGSNQGTPVQNIEEALKHLQEHPAITVKSTSALYVSKAMYYTEQADFYNGVVKLAVNGLSPHDLLAVLKEIEYGKLARVKEFENGPRLIDLDIILFGKSAVTSADLVVPHKSMLERTFVLQPLCELIPPDFVHPVTAEPVHNHLRKLLRAESDPDIQKSSKLVTVVPGNGRNLTFGENSATFIMGVFNATPDSFSDGGENYQLSSEKIIEAALKMKNDGARIIDVGGVSTRPGAKETTTEDELQRVLPVIKAIRSERELDNLLISVDTYRSEVAEQSLQLGADYINDISMGQFDQRIFKVVADFGCGYIMNHTRGTPETMSKLTNYEGCPDNLVEYLIDPKVGILPASSKPVINGVCRELAEQIEKAMAAGVRKWQIVVDPGIGFAKNIEQNLQIVKNAKRFKEYSQIKSSHSSDGCSSSSYLSFNGLPVLVGTSRKKFLGTITGEKIAGKRVIPTAASAVACIEQDVDIVRVHDVAEVREAVQTGDAIYKGVY